MIKILIVDDEESIRELIKMNLELAGYECYEAEDGDKAIEMFNSVKPDLVLLDIMLPIKNGYELAPIFVDKGVPVIFLSAKDATVDKVKGLKLGADDYITKPFESIELLARIESVLRRSNKGSNEFKYKNIVVNFDKREVLLDNAPVELTNKEFELLEIFIQNKNLALSREKLLELVWGYEFFGDTRTIDMHVQKLRHKLNLDDDIVTVYKYGYRFEVKE